ncbi:MAG: 3-oxoacid CoA-transferase subunit A [Dehalococcoidia bacterium]|nr:3-oxoacid CoA-transferase subunit A [Dehalococcoidia bacterium]MDW8119217.1 3-oxoacid CoA-transferase subunit A [Chloroflexota bacterium]
MPIRKVVPTFREAVADIPDGATLFLDGFGGPGGMPHFLILALWEHGAKNLTIISNTAGIAMAAGFGMPGSKRYIDHSILIENGQVRKVIASFPVTANPSVMSAAERAWREGKLEIETVPQGTLVERIRAGGAGIAAFYTPTGVGTLLEQGKEKRVFNGREYVLETALTADYAFIRAWRADRLGNLVYRGTSRNFNAVMATAARITIAEVDEVVEPGVLDPDHVHTPAVYVKRIVVRPQDETPILAETYERLRQQRAGQGNLSSR